MSIVLTPEGTPASPVEGELYYDSTAKGAKLRIENEFKDVGTAFPQGEPHIIPGVLYPAVAGNDLSGTALGGSYVYGTAHTDGRKYYYTDIKGSKPIKDPRIGGHFGSQRHKFKSLQLLEQETATHGKNVYSVDGREWLRFCGTPYEQNSDNGHVFRVDTAGDFLEITGYFNQFNFLGPLYHSSSARNRWIMSVDGTATVTDSSNPVNADNPLGSRYVDNVSLRTYATGITQPRIVTIKMTENSNDTQNWMSGCELIAQDTTSDANRSKIQIPSQNVVSYGKKFTVSGTPHYDPFNGFTSGSSVSSYVDTATSLGLDKWLHSSNYYRPYNGMRVIKWVDENGTIKTSVTCMPPNAKSIGDSSSLTNGTAKANASVANNTFYPTFEAHTTDVNEDNLHEVAKTFYWREFGNGSANEGSTTSGSYQDASMLDGYNEIAYVMDDGLTSLSADDVNNTGGAGGMHLQGDGDDYYITFIGTGIAIKDLGGTHGGTDSYKWYIDGVEVKNFTSGYVYPNSFLTVAQNLPYGSHILQVERVTANTYGQRFEEVSFYQPKKPPIPEDACVLADYMLMADFLGLPDNTSGLRKIISKGVRRASGTRDVTYPEGGIFQQDFQADTVGGFRILSNSSGFNFNLPYFGTNPTFIGGSYTDRSTANQFKVNDTLVTTSSSGTNHSGTQVLTSFTSGSNGFSTDNDGSFTLYNTSLEPAWATVTGIKLGVNKVSIHNGSTHYLILNYFDIATPIHTSSHYQSFESPFLHELIGGDRNMEQTNLVCSPDGKTWDEVTRDTSYLGDGVLFTRNLQNYTDPSSVHIHDDWRGVEQNKTFYNKDSFAIAYDRVICLKDGQYILHFQNYHNASGDRDILINGVLTARDYESTGASAHIQLPFSLKKGDYIQTRGVQQVNDQINFFWIVKV